MFVKEKFEFELVFASSSPIPKWMMMILTLVRDTIILAFKKKQKPLTLLLPCPYLHRILSFA